LPGQHQRHGRPPARLALQVNSPAMALNEFTGIEKSQAEPAHLAGIAGIDLIELFEDLRQLDRKYPSSRIPDDQLHGIGRNLSRERNGASFGSELDGIVQHCLEGEIDPLPIEFHRRVLPLQGTGDGDSLGGGGVSQGGQNRLGQIPEIDRTQLGRTFLQNDLAVIKKVLDQICQVVGFLEDKGERRLKGRIIRIPDAAGKVLDEQGDGRNGGLELVGNKAEKVGFEAV